VLLFLCTTQDELLWYLCPRVTWKYSSQCYMNLGTELLGTAAGCTGLQCWRKGREIDCSWLLVCDFVLTGLIIKYLIFHILHRPGMSLGCAINFLSLISADCTWGYPFWVPEINILNSGDSDFWNSRMLQFAETLKITFSNFFSLQTAKLSPRKVR
jgi:hypothetical protein